MYKCIKTENLCAKDVLYNTTSCHFITCHVSSKLLKNISQFCLCLPSFFYFHVLLQLRGSKCWSVSLLHHDGAEKVGHSGCLKSLQTLLSGLVRGQPLQGGPGLSLVVTRIRQRLANCRFHWCLARILTQSSLEQRLSEYSCSICREKQEEQVQKEKKPTVGMEAAQTQAAVYRKLHITCTQTVDFLSLNT